MTKLVALEPSTEAPVHSHRILLVDDDPATVRVMAAMLRAQGYHDVTHAASGEEALRAVGEKRPDLILLDVMLPGMDGYEVAARVKDDPATQAIPIIMVTTLQDRQSRLLGLKAGVEEFLTKPADRVELTVRVRNLLRIKDYNDFLADHARILEREVRERTAALRDSYRDTIYVLTQAAEYKDEVTGAHVQRLSFYTALLAEELGMSADFADAIFYASPMHDIGKIGIPDHVLMKEGPLTEKEWGIMRSHSALGARILHHASSPYLRMGAEIALHHHERWDGGGYPNALSGHAIPMSARIMAVCDQYDALRSRRPYKGALDHDTTLAILTEGDGRTQPGHFDPQVLATFESISGRFAEIFDT
ncbi:MAG TPA: HD domain-containing phosphohydrolase, partial [Burkholderiales bacterium]|nr:HD domain-containing phosphohydrolase [Burkholderiales bacterium]